MKIQITKAFTLLSLVAAMAIATSAQSVRTIKFNIPFDSTIGKKALPAGEYVLRVIDGTANKTIMLQNNDGTVKVAMANGTPVQQRKVNERAKLIFNRYGDQYFLSQLWEVGSDVGQKFPQSRAERELRNGVQTAHHQAAPGTVTLMARQ